MNYTSILSELQGGNDYSMFSTNTALTKWLIFRYGEVWAAADWPFKTIGPTTLAVTGGAVTVAAPATMFKPIFVFDDLDNPLSEIAPIEFFRQFCTLAATSSGRPTHYCFINKTFYFGPTPSASATFTLIGERLLSQFAADGITFVNGAWDGVTNTQQPIWDASFHYLLVHGAAATGFAFIGSPMQQTHEQLFNDGLQRMISFYAPFDHRSNYQFSRDQLT